MPAAPAKKKTPAHAEQRDKPADVAITALYELYPTTSIDSLLTWPRRALTLCREVAVRLGRRCTEELEHEVCRSLLNTRKHGDLKRDRQ
jgi:hypothetical protein